MKLLTALALVGVLCLQVGTLPVSAQSSKTQKECQLATQRFYSAKKTIKLNLSSGKVIVEPDGKSFTATKCSNFKFVGFLKLTVNGTGTISKSFPNGEQGGTVSFDGVGTIFYNDSGQVVFDGTKQLKVTANNVTEVVLLDNTIAEVTNCHYVDAFRNSIVSAKDCENVYAYTQAQVTVQGCRKTKAYDNAKLTEIKPE